MEESELIFTIFYILMCMSVIFPPKEFVELGLSINHIFSNFLGSEQAQFVRYHQKLTTTNLAIHASMPAFYFLVDYLRFSQVNENVESTGWKIIWSILQNLSILLVLAVAAIILFWYQNNWKNHPITDTLRRFSSNYESVAINIADEFRRPETIHMKINSISSVVATENWIIKTTPYFVHFVHQSDTALVVNKTETFNITRDSSDVLQMVNIDVTSSRRGVKKFKIRINALEFKSLQDHISRPITIPPNIKFHQNLTDRFIETFKELIAINQKYETSQILETCLGCMNTAPNVKITKQCSDVDGQTHDQNCRECYCQPMWCADCLARWFASRQIDHERDTWLEKKCTCPLCRAKFCIRDVCFIKISNP